MHGHMGMDRVTTRNLKVLKVDAENNLLVRPRRGAGRERRLRPHSQGRRGKPEPQPQLQEKPKKGKK